MALSPETLSQLQQLIQSGDAEDLSSEQIVEILNQERNSGNEFVAGQTTAGQNIPDSVFKQLDRDDIVLNRRQFVSQGVWSNGRAELETTEMNLSDCQTDEESSKYFFEVWDSDPDAGPTAEAARVQFYVAYGNRLGGGSPKVSVDTPEALEATRATYLQYKNILLSPDEEGFEFGEGTGVSDDFYAINVGRARYKQIFDPGNWQLTLRFEDPNSSGGANYSELTLVDESATTDFQNEQIAFGTIGRVLNVTAGSLDTGNSTRPPDSISPNEDLLIDNSETYGLFYPDVGIILLNPSALEEHARNVFGTGPSRAYISQDYLNGISNDDAFDVWNSSTGSNGAFDGQNLNNNENGNGAAGPDLNEIAATLDLLEQQIIAGSIQPSWFWTYTVILEQGSSVTNEPTIEETVNGVAGRVYEWPEIEIGSAELGVEDILILEVPRLNLSTSAVLADYNDSVPLPYLTSSAEQGRADAIIPNTLSDQNYKNQELLFEAMSAGGSFIGRSVEEVVSTHYFIRVRNRDFNFSNNPTFAQSDGSFTNPTFFQDPKVYITTVGLYDDDNQLNAVAKLSQPVQKDFGREALIKVKLDYLFVFMVVKFFLMQTVLM